MGKDVDVAEAAAAAAPLAQQEDSVVSEVLTPASAEPTVEATRQQSPLGSGLARAFISHCQQLGQLLPLFLMLLQLPLLPVWLTVSNGR